ncbi:MAG TPA: pyruvate, water dikinase regulatory protein [Gammaproteobacteria bacterium]|jgi:regulator of PEP synthase PpsR (kinase-PPPase family)
MRRTIFFISDQTGITVEALGHSLLTQFDGLDYKPMTVPFVDTVDKARRVAASIDSAGLEDGLRPIVFASLVRDDVRAALLQCNALVLDYFDAFLVPIERELASRSSHALGRAHGIGDSQAYNMRIEATNFAMAADDGHAVDHYDRADVILTGVSRSGKTPTCLYMALQYGVFAANYPLTDEDLEAATLPTALRPQLGKLYGLTIAPERLRQIRLERRAQGVYATAQQISFELRAAEALFKRHGIRCIDTTHSSIEEIASTILSEAGLERRVRL